MSIYPTFSFLIETFTRTIISLCHGRSQPHSPGWARVPLSSFFPQISINFSWNFTYSLPHFGPPGGQLAPLGKALATPLVFARWRGKWGRVSDGGMLLMKPSANILLKTIYFQWMLASIMSYSFPLSFPVWRLCPNLYSGYHFLQKVGVPRFTKSQSQ